MGKQHSAYIPNNKYDVQLKEVLYGLPIHAEHGPQMDY